MKINELKKKLRSLGCCLEREGGNHEWWYSPISRKHFPLPRHGAQEVPKGTLKK